MKINNPFFIFIRKDERYMPDKLTALRIKQQDGTYSAQIPVGALAENVAYNNDYDLKTILGNVDMTKGNLQSQINTKVDPEYVEGQISEDVSNWLNDNVDPVGSAVVVDTSLSITGAAADAKATGDGIADLKSAIQFITPKVFNTNNLLLSPNTQIFPNKMYYSAEEHDAVTLSYAIVPMIGGETYVIVPPARFITYNTGTEATNTPANYEFTPSSDRDVYITFRNDVDTYGGWCVYKKGAVDPSKVGSYQVPCAGDWFMNASCVDISPNMLNTALSTNGYYMDTTGNTNSSSTGVLSYSTKIPVEAGKTYYIKYENSNRAVARFVTAYSGGDVVSSSGATYAESWTCPSGITDIIITYYNDAGTVMFSDAVRNYIPYGDYYVPFDKIEYDGFKKSVDEVLSNLYKYNYLTAKASTLTNTESINLTENSVKTKKSMTFTANISTFNAIYVGHGKSVYAASYAKIDNTNLIVYNYNDQVIGTYAHGLTLTNNIQVYIEKGITQKAKIRIISNGYAFEQSNIDWIGDNGNIFVTSDGSTLTNCVLSWTTKTFKSDIWLCGDSYFGISNNARWVYYLLQDGYTNCLLSGYGGCGSEDAYQKLVIMLQHGKPKKLIWCLGMNDNDSSTAVNASWLLRYNSVKTLCENNNIELILATIPNAVGGTVDDNPDASLRKNTFKNQIVRESGFRYIDFAKAVGAQEDGTWFNGMLSSDGVHPTEYGARALYMQALSDAPELMTC